MGIKVKDLVLIQSVGKRLTHAQVVERGPGKIESQWSDCALGGFNKIIAELIKHLPFILGYGKYGVQDVQLIPAVEIDGPGLIRQNKRLQAFHITGSWTTIAWIADQDNLLPIYLGFKGDVAANGAQRYCQWFYESWDIEQSRWDVSPDNAPGRVGVLFCSFPSVKDPRHDPGEDSRHTGEIITFVPWDAFSRWTNTKWKKRGADYEAFKETLTEQLLEQSSIKSGLVEVSFMEGNFKVPGCYYEFARRYPSANGELFSGFIAKSADKIFESTNFYKK